MLYIHVYMYTVYVCFSFWLQGATGSRNVTCIRTYMHTVCVFVCFNLTFVVAALDFIAALVRIIRVQKEVQHDRCYHMGRNKKCNMTVVITWGAKKNAT